MTVLKLQGLVGTHLFGFLASYGLLRLLHRAALRSRMFHPRLYFAGQDYCAVLDGVPSAKFVEDTIRGELQALHRRLKTDFGEIAKPSDLNQEFVDKIVRSNDVDAMDELAGLGCVLAGEPHETSLCAANGAGHQNLVLSMRDVLALLEEHPDRLSDAMNGTWTLAFEPTPEDRKKLALGKRKPTLRLDPSDERLYALRFDNPTSNTYRTELGAQALAAAAFGGLPVVPQQDHPIAVGSERRGMKTYFYWGLWSVPASYATVRSLIVTGARDIDSARTRGVFTAFRAARVTGAKGKLSFAPTEPWW